MRVVTAPAEDRRVEPRARCACGAVLEREENDCPECTTRYRIDDEGDR